MEKMPSRPFKLLVGKGTQEKVPIIATSYEDLLQKVCEKLNCEGVLYTEDHTEITAEYYDFLENFTVVYLKASPDVSEIESIESEPDIAAVREITVQKTLVDFGTMDTEKHKAHIQRQTKILAEHGKNANYNKEINKTCYKLVLKTPELLNKGNRGTLLKNARLEVNKVYPFKRKRRHANADSGPKPKLSKKCRQQRIADINDRLLSIESKTGILLIQIRTKTLLNLTEEADALQTQLDNLYAEKKGLKIEKEDLNRKENKSGRDSRYHASQSIKTSPSATVTYSTDTFSSATEEVISDADTVILSDDEQVNATISSYKTVPSTNVVTKPTDEDKSINTEEVNESVSHNSDTVIPSNDEQDNTEMSSDVGNEISDVTSSIKDSIQSVPDNNRSATDPVIRY